MQYLWESTLEVRDEWLDIYFFFTNFPRLSKIRYIKSPGLSYNLQVCTT